MNILQCLKTRGQDNECSLELSSILNTFYADDIDHDVAELVNKHCQAIETSVRIKYHHIYTTQYYVASIHKLQSMSFRLLQTYTGITNCVF